MPIIEDQLDKLSGSKVFTSLDMASGYYQIPVAEGSVAKTAFVTPDGQYEFLKMTFGLVNAPALFQRLVNNVLGSLLGTVALTYLHDILIPTADYESELKSLEQVLIALQSAGLTLRLKKCYFFK